MSVQGKILSAICFMSIAFIVFIEYKIEDNFINLAMASSNFEYTVTWLFVFLVIAVIFFYVDLMVFFYLGALATGLFED